MMARIRVSADGTPVPNVIYATRGSCIHATFEWLDAQGNTVDITGHAVSILSAPSQTIADAELTVEDGALLFHLHRPLLRSGKVHKFRTQHRAPGEHCPHSSKDVWINIV